MKNSPIAKSLALMAAFSLSLMMIVFIFSEPVMAQATTGTLSGTVTDAGRRWLAGSYGRICHSFLSAHD